MIPDQIAALRRLHEQATPGPWKAHHSDNIICAPLNNSGDGRALTVAQARSLQFGDQPPLITEEQRDRNADLIAAMRNALPDLLDLVERTQWRPIADAPERILAIGWIPAFGNPWPVIKKDGVWRLYLAPYWECEPTHWMPLPDPPAKENAR